MFFFLNAIQSANMTRVTIQKFHNSSKKIAKGFWSDKLYDMAAKFEMDKTIFVYGF